MRFCSMDDAPIPLVCHPHQDGLAFPAGASRSAEAARVALAPDEDLPDHGTGAARPGLAGPVSARGADTSVARRLVKSMAEKWEDETIVPPRERLRYGQASLGGT
jgi:hypothetical protein